MLPSKIGFYLLSIMLVSCSRLADESEQIYDVIVVGGGASGVTAGLQSARMGVKTILISDLDWLGGMLTSAGVSAMDGNNNLPSGLWGEFRDSLVLRYGSRTALETGWVSNTLFEPSVGNEIFHNMVAKEPNLKLVSNTQISEVRKESDHWLLKSRLHSFHGKILIDATELGDVAKMAGVSYDIGMNDGISEPRGPEEANDIIQDLTWVAILKDYGSAADKTIPKPANYDPSEFSCACNTGNPEIKAVDCKTMLNYGKLPNGKYMINWPNCGNDTYVNVIEMSQEDRKKALIKAKETTLRFVYYIQDELGFKNLGLAEQEFGTEDFLPFIPYHRESRRVRGKVRLLSTHLENPYSYNLYKTGIAVGDYPIDHHHDKNLDAPDIDFIGIKIPAYNVPLGCLISEDVEDIIVAEKSISVSNIVNGATRLQPVVLGIGQAAGGLAAVAVRNSLSPRHVKIRDLQEELLRQGVYLMPFMDVPRDDPDFIILQKAGVMGLLKGSGIPYKWANQMWLYPDSLMKSADLQESGEDYDLQIGISDQEFVTPTYLLTFIAGFKWDKNHLEEVMTEVLALTTNDGFLSRRQVSKIVIEHTELFAKPINFQGDFIAQ